MAQACDPDMTDDATPPLPGGPAAQRLREQLAREFGEVPAENPPDRIGPDDANGDREDAAEDNGDADQRAPKQPRR